MSKRMWGVTALAAALIVTAVLVAFYFRQEAGIPPEEQRGTELVELVPTEITPDMAAASEKESLQDTEQTQNTSGGVYQFLLVNDNNYVAVYSLPENEIYEYTDVILDVLPAELQEEIRQGKYLRNEEELYNFLENYTS